MVGRVEERPDGMVIPGGQCPRGARVESGGDHRMAMAFAVLLYWRHELALYLFAFLAGISWLATPGSVTALTSEVYGMRTLGTLAGVSLLVHQLGGGASVWLAGVLYDTTGSYDVSFQLGALGLIAASLVSWMIAERRYSVRYLAPSASAD